MKNNNSKIHIMEKLIIISISLLFCTQVFSQNVTIVDRGDDRYVLDIGGKTFIALTVEKMSAIKIELDTLKIELEAVRKEQKADKRLITSLENTRDTYSKNFWLQDSILEQTRNLYTGYRDLYFDYKAAYSEPWLYFQGGIGAVRERHGDQDMRPVILLGLSIKRLAFWGFINSEQSGFLMGINYPIPFKLSIF